MAPTRQVGMNINYAWNHVISHHQEIKGMQSNPIGTLILGPIPSWAWRAFCKDTFEIHQLWATLLFFSGGKWWEKNGYKKLHLSQVA